LFRQAGDAAFTSGFVQGGSLLLSGASNIASSYYASKQPTSYPSMPGNVGLPQIG
jgi:hypothetical protein